jgi:heparan-alpha-glucosaminide N-acetyltransferase
MSQATPQSTGRSEAPFLKRRLRSLDIFRGLIMISLAFGGFGLAQTAKKAQQENAQTILGSGDYEREIRWDIVEHQFSHVQWTGYGFWDMIQPSFMFMVGVSLAFSYAHREKRGDSYWKMLFHAAVRSVVLVLLGIFLISNGQNGTRWSFMNVLTQIGLGYTFLFLFWKRGFLVQVVGIAVILTSTFAAYRFDPNVGVPADAKELAAIGLNEEWVDQNLTDIDPHWHKNANFGHHVDLWFLNLLPQQREFEFSGGGYQTFNFIPSLATMLLGLICGEMLIKKRESWMNLGQMLALGAVCIAIGYGLDHFNLCPLIKRIWSPSWALFSGGICVVTLTALYLLFDVMPLSPLAYPATVVGTNSLLMYCMGQLLKPWTRDTLVRHFGEGIFSLQPQLGYRVFSAYPFKSPPPHFEIYIPMCESIMIGMCFWLVCLWLHRQRLFVRI